MFGLRARRVFGHDEDLSGLVGGDVQVAGCIICQADRTVKEHGSKLVAVLSSRGKESGRWGEGKKKKKRKNTTHLKHGTAVGPMLPSLLQFVRLTLLSVQMKSIVPWSVVGGAATVPSANGTMTTLCPVGPW